MKISIIIPVYNIGTFLPLCITSALSQENVEIEVLLIDDGSLDSSGNICDQYANIDNRIRVIHKENGGLSDARNVGVSAATGDFVMFLDGDDLWSDPQALERLVERQKQTDADVVNYSYVRWFEDTGEKLPYIQNVAPMPPYRTKEEQVKYLTANGLYIASACNKLIRRSVLDGLKFRKGVYSEDIEWCAELLLRAKSMDFVCENFYMYRQHSASIRHTINQQKCDDLADNILRCFHLIENANAETIDALMHYTAFQFGTFFMVQAQAEQAPWSAIEKLKGYSWILKYHGSNKKLALLRWGCKLLGYKNLCRVIRCFFGK